jgi:hypothetical protein
MPVVSQFEVSGGSLPALQSLGRIGSVRRFTLSIQQARGQAMLTIPGGILLVMLLILIGGMFSGFNHSGAAGFFTMAIFGAALLMLVAYVFG